MWASCLVYSHAEAELKLNKERIKGVDLKRISMRFILMMGLVSLFGDMAYEGARSSTGAYMATLGASAGIVGFVSGFGELLDMRYVSFLVISQIEPKPIGLWFFWGTVLF